MRSKLSYANVTATLALFIALGGGAYAATQLPDNSVSSKTIRNGQVKGVDVAEKTLGAVPKAKQAEKTHGLRTYRVSKALDEGDNLVTVWKQGSFRLKASCFRPVMGSTTQALAMIGSPKPGVAYSSVAGREGVVDPELYANDGADAGDYGVVARVTASNTSPLVGSGNFAAILTGPNGVTGQTVTGNLSVLARHGADGKDCSVSGQISNG